MTECKRQNNEIYKFIRENFTLYLKVETRYFVEYAANNLIIMKSISVNNESIRVFLSMKETFECSVNIRKIDRQRAEDHLEKYGEVRNGCQTRQTQMANVKTETKMTKNKNSNFMQQLPSYNNENFARFQNNNRIFINCPTKYIATKENLHEQKIVNSKTSAFLRYLLRQQRNKIVTLTTQRKRNAKNDKQLIKAMKKRSRRA